MVDAIMPFADEFAAGVGGRRLTDAWAAAATAAQTAAERTADYASSRGRSKLHGDRSIGTPDPGAVSFALVVGSVLT